jgi:GntR family transcriptional repressor for pyruvate dehydrogenase complex
MTTKRSRTASAPTELTPRPRRIKLVDEIIESLRQDIVTRRLPDGNRLPSEKDLSERFGVSQPTIREAIRALETLGLVEVLHGNGTFVRSQGDFALASAMQTLLQLESVGIMDVIEIRAALGRFSIELAVANATDEDIAEMTTFSDRFDHVNAMKEADEVIANVIGFQRALSASAHNSLLQSLETFLLVLLNEVQAQSFADRGVTFWRTRARDFQTHRIDILNGIRARDAIAARAAMDRYFDAQRERFDKDDILRALNLSNPGMIGVVADMVRRFRT